MHKLLAKMDIPLFIITIVYCIVGLIMIYSSSSVSAVILYDYTPYHYFIRQAIFLIASFLVVFPIVISMPTRNYKVFAWPAVIILVISLALLFVKGKITNNAISWYDLGVFKLQPSEFAKSILIVFSAVYYNGLLKRKVRNIYPYLIPMAVGVVVAGLVLMQPDLGSAAIIGMIVFLIFISIPNVRTNMVQVFKIMAIAVVVGGLAFLYTGSSLLNNTQLDRFNFKNPCSRYTERTGYQVCNGFIAINNGGVTGVGLGNSTQKYLYLPESHTDFIFPIIVEELGLIVGVLLILGYGFILFRIYRIARRSENLRCSVLAYGTFWYLGLHILINLLGVLALIPLTGVPLPLLSYGGSFTINALLMLFIVQRVNIENNINRTKREIKAL